MQYQNDKILLAPMVESYGTAFALFLHNDKSLHHDLKRNEAKAGRDNTPQGKSNGNSTHFGRQ